MRNKGLAALLLVLIMLLTGTVRAEESPASAAETAASAPETATPAPETATPAPETATPAPETATPAPETATPAPETATPAPETATPTPETATPAPETATPTPGEATPRPFYPRAFFDASWAIVDASQAVQGGYVLVALPIAIEPEQGARVYSSAAGTQSGWRPDGENSPLYFSQAIMDGPMGSGWELDSAGAYDVYDLFSPSVRDMIDYAPQDNPWMMAPGTPYNAGYTVFVLDVRPDAPAGRHRLRFVYDLGDDLMNEAPVEFVMDLTIAAAMGPTDAPDETEPPTDWPEPPSIEEGSIGVGQVAVQTLKVGQSGVTMAIPVSYTTSDARLYSNRDDEGNVLEPGADGFNTDILDYIEWLEIEITAEAAADLSFPFSLSEQGVSRKVIENGVNNGYAVFSGLTVKKNLSNGTVAVPFAVRYYDLAADKILTGELTALVNITGASTGYGGGGGGGSYTAPTAAPQARVIVESIATDPAGVQAGDVFDVVLQLRNTSAKQYVQNMRITIDAQDDALLPTSGSNTVFVSRIDAGALYELRYPVRAALDIPDRPLKLDVSIEYEDQAVASQSASQQMILSVAQQMRVSVGDPILKEASIYTGDSADVSVQVINEGRTMIYNVTVTAVSDASGLLLPAAGYLGNMEGGTSKKSDLSLVPTEAGVCDVTLLVSWENARGERFSETRPVSFTARSEETYDYWNNGGLGGSYAPSGSELGYADEYDDENSLSDLLALLPWWIYAAAAGVYFLIVVYIAVSVRARRRKAMEDDEID